MKIEVCDNCVYVDGVEHTLLSNNTGASRIRQTIEIGAKTGVVAPPPPPEPEPVVEATADSGEDD